MAYEKTRKLLADAHLSPTELRDILDSWADELEEAEPYATRSIRQLRYAVSLADELED